MNRTRVKRSENILKNALLKKWIYFWKIAKTVLKKYPDEMFLWTFFKNDINQIDFEQRFPNFL